MSEGYEVPLSYRGDRLGREFNPAANGMFLTKKEKRKKKKEKRKKKKEKEKCPTSGERLESKSLVHKFGFTVDEGKEWLNPSREKI